MSQDCPILRIEIAPGDAPRAVEQLNGDLLVPGPARPTLERALRMAEDALMEGHEEERAVLAAARKLLGIVVRDTPDRVAANLLKVRRL
jgi:hypothetical protein